MDMCNLGLQSILADDRQLHMFYDTCKSLLPSLIRSKLVPVLC